MPLSLNPSLVLLALAVLLFIFGRWREKRYRPGGRPALIPPVMIQMLAGIVIIVLAAHLFSLATGISWSPPHRGP